MTNKQLSELVSKQENKCGICFNCFTPKAPHNSCIDHNHKTGKVRGLLCSTCNRALGMLKDDPNILEKAIAWLEKG